MYMWNPKGRQALVWPSTLVNFIFKEILKVHIATTHYSSHHLDTIHLHPELSMVT